MACVKALQTQNHEQALKDVKSDVGLLHRGALNVLKHLVRRDDKLAKEIMEQVAVFATSNNPLYKEVYNDLTFEFEHRS